MLPSHGQCFWLRANLKNVRQKNLPAAIFAPRSSETTVRADRQALARNSGIAGVEGYATGALSAIGDGEFGGEVALALGRNIGPFAFGGDIGDRTRSSTIPDKVFGAISPSISPPAGSCSLVNAASGLDIGGPGFSFHTRNRLPLQRRSQKSTELHPSFVRSSATLRQQRIFRNDHGV